MVLAILIGVIQFFGFPTSWNKVLTIICAFIVIGIAYKMAPTNKPVDEKVLPFVDHKRDDAPTITNQNIVENK